MKKNMPIILLLFCLTACDKKIEKLEIAENPTSFVFNASLEEVQAAVKEKFKSSLSFRQMFLYFPNDPMLPSELDYLKDENYINDAVLYPGDFIIGASYNYKRNGGQLPYRASFQIHLEFVSKDSTKVQIVTVEPILFIGVKPGRGLLPSHPGDAETMPAEPSSIEEYEILFMTGEYLGESKRMPPIIYPSD